MHTTSKTGTNRYLRAYILAGFAGVSVASIASFVATTAEAPPAPTPDVQLVVEEESLSGTGSSAASAVNFDPAAFGIRPLVGTGGVLLGDGRDASTSIPTARRTAGARTADSLRQRRKRCLRRIRRKRVPLR